MRVHLALYAWRPESHPDDANAVMAAITASALASGGLQIAWAGPNHSEHAAGFTHVALLVGDDASVERYRASSVHAAIAARLAVLIDQGVGVDLDLGADVIARPADPDT